MRPPALFCCQACGRRWVSRLVCYGCLAAEAAAESGRSVVEEKLVDRRARLTRVASSSKAARLRVGMPAGGLGRARVEA